MNNRHSNSRGILLINPKNPAYRSNFPLGIAYIAAILQKKGYPVEVLPCDLYHLENIHIAKYICQAKQDIIGITGVYPDLREIIRLCQFIKQILPNKIIVLGGPLVTSLPEYVMHKTGADVGVLGEAESVIPSLMEGLHSNSFPDLYTVPNLILRNEQDMVRTVSNKSLIPIDDIPWPARHIFPMDFYLRTTKYPLDPVSDRQIELLSTRGCPYNCSFCYHPGPFRLRSVEDVMDEIDYCIATYGASHFYFRDDLFMASEDRIAKICEAIMLRSFSITYHINGKLDIVNSNILKLLKSSGCIMIGYGMESADQSILDSMGKGFTVEQAEQGIRLTREHEIYPVYSVMWGHPGDNEVTMRKLVTLLKRLSYGEFNERYPYACTPFPGSALYEWALQCERIKNHDDFFNKFQSMKTPAINMTKMNDLDFFRCFHNAHLELRLFYAAQASSWRNYFSNRNKER